MYSVVSNKIVNLTRKALKDQLFNGKIEEYLSYDSRPGGNDNISSIKQNLNQEDYTIKEKAKEASYKSNKMDKYENKIKDKTIKMIRKENDHKANNLFIKPNQEMEEIGILVNDFNKEANNKSNEIKRKIEEENVLSTETKQINDGDAIDHDENDNDNHEKERNENITIDHKYHKKESC